MQTVEHKGNEYRVDKLSAMEQLHVSRKIGPIIPSIIPLFQSLGNGDLDKVMAGGDAGDLAKAMEPFAEALSEMDDKHVEYVYNVCLAKVLRKQGDVWSPIWRNGNSMFDDLEMDVLLFLFIQVVKYSLGNFIRGLATQATPTPLPA